MHDTLRATALKTKREVVEVGLLTLLRHRKQAEIRQLRRKLGGDAEMGVTKTDRCHRSIPSVGAPHCRMSCGVERA